MTIAAPVVLICAVGGSHEPILTAFAIIRYPSLQFCNRFQPLFRNSSCPNLV